VNQALAELAERYFQVCMDASPFDATVYGVHGWDDQVPDLSEAAEEMPEDRYAFKPTQAQMTFGEIVLHVAEANAFLCSAIARTPLPEQRRLVPTDSKDKLGGLLEDSFDVCDDVLDHADDSFLEDSIPYFGGRRTTRAAALIELASMWATNYSYLAIYLRLNGLEPPTAKRK